MRRLQSTGSRWIRHRITAPCASTTCGTTRESTTRSPASGTLQVIYGYAQAWEHFSRLGSVPTELSLVEDGAVVAQAPETWTLQDTGGNELGVEIPQRSADVKLIEKQNGAPAWREPGERTATVRPGKDAVTVCVAKGVDAQVVAHGDHVAARGAGVGEARHHLGNSGATTRAEG